MWLKLRFVTINGDNNCFELEVIELDDRQVIEADGSKFFDCYKWICLDGVIGLVSMVTTTHIVSMVVMMEPNKLLILMTIDKWLKPAVRNFLIRTYLIK